MAEVMTGIVDDARKVAERAHSEAIATRGARIVALVGAAVAYDEARTEVMESMERMRDMVAAARGTATDFEKAYQRRIQSERNEIGRADELHVLARELATAHRDVRRAYEALANLSAVPRPRPRVVAP